MDNVLKIFSREKVTKSGSKMEKSHLQNLPTNLAPHLGRMAP